MKSKQRKVISVHISINMVTTLNAQAGRKPRASHMWSKRATYTQTWMDCPLSYVTEDTKNYIANL